MIRSLVCSGPLVSAFRNGVLRYCFLSRPDLPCVWDENVSWKKLPSCKVCFSFAAIDWTYFKLGGIDSNSIWQGVSVPTDLFRMFPLDLPAWIFFFLCTAMDGSDDFAIPLERRVMFPVDELNEFLRFAALYLPGPRFHKRSTFGTFRSSIGLGWTTISPCCPDGPEKI